ncbi:unnamed protein product [Meganyctiphanes norvegica]|uniref:RING-type domain-containing protein n=1 Tax=Meganyctiphanes norvegica TaxID=48144 RepID=A0AAV2RG49_MEGNR
MDPLDCSVCWNRYDLDRYRPRSLTCGHSLCSDCINRTIRGSNLYCPICRRQHERIVNSASDFPVNFTVQEMLRSQQHPAVPTGENMISVFEKSKLEVSESFVAQVMNFDAHIGQVKNVLNVTQVKKNAINEKIEPLMVQLKIVQKEEENLLEILNSGVQHRAEYDQVNEGLQDCSSESELRTIQKHVENVHNRVKDWFKKTELYIPIENHILPTPNVVFGGNVNVTSLRNLVHSKPGGVWCVLNRPEDAGDSWAKVSIRQEILLLHTLHSTPPIVDSSVSLIPYSDVRRLVDDSKATTFLEISVPGQHESKLIFLELQGFADRTVQFRLLCSGEMGVSYAGTFMIRKGEVGNAIVAGTRNDSIVKTLPGLLGTERPLYETQTLVTSGLLSAMEDITTEPTQFCIYGKHDFQQNEMRPMGRVVFGLETIQHLYADVENITGVKIIDCGLVLSL